MNIRNINEGPTHLIVKLSLVTDKQMDLGKIEITARWEAVSKQLLRQLDKQGKLVQIDAAETTHNGYWQISQFFTFYFLKENQDGSSEIKEDESKD